MFVLLGTLKASGLDIFYAYSALWIVAFRIQICCDRLQTISNTTSFYEYMLLNNVSFMQTIGFNNNNNNQ